MSNLYNLEIEKHFLSVVLQFPEVWGEVSFVSEKDFTPINKAVLTVIRQQLDEFPPQPVTTVILSEKLKAYNVKIDGVEISDYLEALKLKPIRKEEAVQLLKELKKLTVRRELVEKCREAEKALISNPDNTFEEMVSVVDSTLSSVNTEFYKSETTNVFSDIIDVIEERGNNPVSVDDLGYMGPFPSFNQTFGALCFPGSLTVIGSRTGGGKSSLGFFYQLYLAEKYNLPILHLDAAEMTIAQLQGRAVCCMSNGRIPLWAVRSGEWRKNKEWTSIIRDEIWPRVKKVKIHYQNVGEMSPKDVISFVKRFYYKNVGRGNHLLIHDDYQKGVEAIGKNVAEYQAIGYKIGAIKSLITDEITASYWTSVQNNRSGVYTGKSLSEIKDSEDAMGLSDRIIQQATNGFLMRYKVPEELALEQNKFGNVKISSVKERELMGKSYERNLAPVKLPNGKYVKNYFNLNTHNFFYEDRGDLKNMLQVLGHEAIKLYNTNKNDNLI